jgi:class 3 adenylate cyclase/YHS domain-containing protein
MEQRGRHRRGKGEGGANPKRRGAGRAEGAQQNSAGVLVAKGHGSVLWAEFRGLTWVCSQIEVARLALLLQDLFSAMSDVAIANDAVVDRLTGDGAMLLYGVPRARRDDASRAVRTAVAMQEAFLCLRNRWIAEGCSCANQLGLRIGVGSGDLMILGCEIGGLAGRTVLGEVMSRAARLCAAAEPGNLLVDQRTYEQAARSCSGAIDFTSTDATVGRVEQLPAYRCAHHRSGLQLVPRRRYRDPVCGATVDPHNGVDRTIDGEVHHFCSRGCAARYTEDPELFAEGPVKRAGKRA